jgi:hypothetical protein
MSDIALIFNDHIIKAGDMSANIPAVTKELSNVLGYCVQAVWSGSPVGNIVIQAGNDNSNWKVISTTAAGGGSGSLLSNNDGIHYAYVQVLYNFTSGSGTLDVTISGKKYT